MKFICIIPARYASTRLPGKPLADIAGKPLIQRVCEQAQQATKLTMLSSLSIILPYMTRSLPLAATPS